MAERPPATDLRGGNTSEDSFTRLMANFVVAYAVDFQSDLLSGTAPESAVRSEDFERLLWSLQGTGGSETVSGSTLHERVCLDESSRIKISTHRSIPDHEGLRAWGLAKLRCRPEDLGLILWDAVRQDRFHFGLRWGRFHSWLRFALDDGFLEERGIFLTTSFCH